MLTVAALVVVHGVLAGITLLVAALNLWTWSRHHTDRTPLWQGVLSVSLMCVLLAGATVLVRPTGPIYEVALFTRSGMLGVSSVLALFALASLVPGVRIRFTATVLSIVVAVRMVLWFSTDLVMHHGLHEGAWPSYGPLSWTSLIYGLGLLIVTVGALRQAPPHIRPLLQLDLLLTVATAVVTAAAGRGLWFEALLSLNVIPSAACILWLGGRQIVRTTRARDLLVIRQSALAELGRTAVTADAAQVRRSAQQLLRQQVPEADVRLEVDWPADARPRVTGHGVDGLDQAGADFVGSLVQIVAAAIDRAAAEADRAHNATHDALTGLPNRVMLMDRLAARPSGSDTAILVLCGLPALDELISIEGHEAADEAVRRVAARLPGLVPPGGSCGRLSTEVFGLVGSTAPEEVSAYLSELLPTLQTELSRAAGRPIAVGAVVAQPQAQPSDLLRDATAALRRAIDVGGPEIFADDLGIRLRKNAETERALRGAVAAGEIEVHYQPLVHPQTRAVLSYEALARWRRGCDLVPPLNWIPLAEQSGLIGEVGREVLRIACRDQAVLDRPVAVNVSPHQLTDGNFVDVVRSVLGSCPPQRLTLEVTESAMMADLDQAVRTLRELQDLGCSIALDDFGTSYSSLGVLATLPVDVLKIDRMFVDALDTTSGVSVVSTVVALARALGKSTVAEGVETEEQLAVLAELGVDRIQGYLTGRPTALLASATVQPG